MKNGCNGALMVPYATGVTNLRGTQAFVVIVDIVFHVLGPSPHPSVYIQMYIMLLNLAREPG